MFKPPVSTCVNNARGNLQQLFTTENGPKWENEQYNKKWPVGQNLWKAFKGKNLENWAEIEQKMPEIEYILHCK